MKSQSKKTYETPQVITYGNIEALTQSLTKGKAQDNAKNGHKSK